MTPNMLFGTLIILLVTIILAGGALAKLHLDRRDATIRSLSRANIEHQAYLDAQTGEIDGLLDEYVEMSAKYLDMNQRFQPMEEQIAGMDEEFQQLEDELAERDRQLRLARSEGSRQQERADVAEYVGWILVEIVIIDDEIHAEYETLASRVGEMNQLMQAGQYGAANQAYGEAVTAMERLDELFVERDELMSELEW